ncbi:hypothetical protein ACFW1M_23105 [Streptomyces inhibens]
MPVVDFPDVPRGGLEEVARLVLVGLLGGGVAVTDQVFEAGGRV